jgi:hypothetical protein
MFIIYSRRIAPEPRGQGPSTSILFSQAPYVNFNLGFMQVKSYFIPLTAGFS